MRIVKIGGRAQADPRLAASIREAWDAAPGALCIIHGGGDEITAMQNALGRKSSFIGGRRVTSEADLSLLRMVLSGVVNKRLVNSFVAAGIPAVGISGEDGALIGAEIIDSATLGFAGTPVRIESRILRMLLGGGFLPVISPVGYNLSSGTGGTLNVNGDDAAAAIAIALEAQEMLFVADVKGVEDESGVVLSNIHGDFARELIMQGVAAGGMAAKLESAQAALKGGVTRVRICDLSGLGNSDCGTLITQAEGVAS